jgi:hypothetical protein
VPHDVLAWYARHRAPQRRRVDGALGTVSQDAGRLLETPVALVPSSEQDAITSGRRPVLGEPEEVARRVHIAEHAEHHAVSIDEVIAIANGISWLRGDRAEASGVPLGT